MPKPTLEWYDHSFEPYNCADFMVIISDYPELGPMVAEMEIPSRSLGRVRMEFNGKSRIWPGRRISSSNEVNISLLLDRKSQTYQKLIAIQDSFSNPETGNIVGRPFNIRVIHYDSVGDEAAVYTFRECWLAEIGSYQLSGNDEAQVAMVPCVFGYARTSYQFTGIGDAEVSTTIISRISEGPISVGNPDNFGNIPGLNISRQLDGIDPIQRVSQLRQSLASFIGFRIEDLRTMQNVITGLRNSLEAGSSNITALRELTRQRDLQGVISSLSSIKTRFSF